MKVISDPRKMQDFSRKLRRSGKVIGFVPTMGALHRGHLELVKTSRQKDEVTLASIYVNPLQFGPKEDFEKYPRMLVADLELLSKLKVDAVYTPSNKGMYPEGFSTEVKVTGPLVKGLCAPYRPGHFDGVATVVVKLLGATLPTRLYLGQKDAQQVAVLKRVVRDLDMEVEVVACPTVREKDGLAMSSRNLRLGQKGRAIAPVLYRGLCAGRKQALSRKRDARTVLAAVRRVIAREKEVKLQYLEVVEKDSLRPVKRVGPGAMIALAAHLENVRLIDNIIV
jgi:pantoate--beta-alanine ligase